MFQWQKGILNFWIHKYVSTWGFCVGFNGHNLITTGDSEVGVECLRKLVRGLMHKLCQIYYEVDLIFPNKGWCDEFETGLNIIIAIVQKV